MNGKSSTNLKIPSSAQSWLDLFTTEIAVEKLSPSHRQLSEISTINPTEKQAQDFIAASFRFKDQPILNCITLSYWAEIMKRCLAVHPPNLQLGVDVTKNLLSRTYVPSAKKTKSMWSMTAEKWIRSFIYADDKTVVKMLWDCHHYDGKGPEIASCAVSFGSLCILEIFLDRVDPRFNKCALLKTAIGAHNTEAFDRLFVPSPIKNKSGVLDYALRQQRYYSRQKVRRMSKDQEKHEEKLRASQKALDYMIDRLIPQSDLNAIFFGEISDKTQWMIPYLSKKSMARLKKDPHYEKVKHLPQYQRRILSESTMPSSRVRQRKM